MTTEVAPAASGRLAVANPLSGRRPCLIHRPSAVDCRASLRKGLVERYLLVAGDPTEHESSRTERLMGGGRRRPDRPQPQVADARHLGSRPDRRLREEMRTIRAIPLLALAVAAAGCGGGGSKHYDASEVRGCLVGKNLSMNAADLPGDVSPDGTAGDLAVQVGDNEVDLASGKDSSETKSTANEKKA